MICFYHRADLDGRCSGAIVKAHFPECRMIGMDYGEEMPWTEIYPNEEVYLVDFSLQPFEKMIRLQKLAQLIWIDHHKSAIADAEAAGWKNGGNGVLQAIDDILARQSVTVDTEAWPDGEDERIRDSFHV